MIRLALTALILEAVIGYPERLHRRVPHPVTYLGSAISALERRWNRTEVSEETRKVGGVATLALVAGGAGLAGAVATRTLGRTGLGGAALALLATVGLAQRSLYDHVAAVRTALESDDLPAARQSVGRIVGRDVTELDSGAVTAAALESLAESFNDGVVAPAFWLAIGGLPGLFAYKAVNTADSMIGHREPRWRSFGWASARADDLMNLVPARLAGALIALAGARGWRTMVRDARKHASPNAGWPEAAMAGALGVRLGAPTHYDGVRVERAVFGSGTRPERRDLARGLKVYVRACGFLWLLLAGVVACRR
jgi:adenosylcobinamide-phosphate synthase